jgi:hypothetical protein
MAIRQIQAATKILKKVLLISAHRILVNNKNWKAFIEK